MERFPVINKEIEIPGLQKTYRILHVTDVHVILWDKHDEDTVIDSTGPHNGKRLIADFGAKRVKIFTAANGLTTNQLFARLCDRLQEEGRAIADAVVFTGDILDFYTDAAFDFMVENLNKLPIPYLFVPGNHDYIFSDRGTDDALARFSKLCGTSYKIQTMKLGELMLVGSHNGSYFYEDETLALVEEAIRGEDHALLFQHVPIDSPSLARYYKELGRPNYAIGSETCPAQTDGKERFLTLIEQENSPVRALICGDSHVDYSGPLTDRVTQYISPLLRDYPPVLFTIKGKAI